ncbi:hypothetical protein Pmani_000440 [Petrolisthes manimaculis]|uniref:DUF4371 domain-containing protein n=1 Tax=Petrolisthes manimaculis TaxID=1843537 RepID=A0AAE1QPZ3_9EUCA|nr:hypothetical protein Pmani_000440 [Petrolisthes manimaculis]
MEGSDSTDTMEETPITPRKRKVKARAGPTASGSQSHRQQRYRQEWERNPAFKPWLTGTQDQHKAKCLFCNITMVAELTVIKNHAKGKKHCSHLKVVTDKRATTVTTFFEKSNKQMDERVASAEIKIAGVLAAHNVSFNVMDHLSEVLKDAFNDSKIAQEFTLKRTKATAVVRNVISKSYKEELANKLRKTMFSVLTDESTDIGSIKTSCVVVRFFDSDINCVESKFWELCEVYNVDNPEDVRMGATAKNLYERMIETFKSHEIPLTNIIGFGADGCSVMMGAHNSVSSRFRNECPEWALPKFTSFNTYFQSDKTVITELHEKVIILFKDLVLSFMERDYINKTEFSLIDPGRRDKHLRDTEMYLGVKVLQALNDSSITARKPELQEFFQRCRNFLSVACCEIKKRYDFKDPVISKLNTLAPSNAISGEFRKIVPSLVPLATELPLLVSPEDTALLQRLDDQWRMLPLQCDSSGVALAAVRAAIPASTNVLVEALQVEWRPGSRPFCHGRQ